MGEIVIVVDQSGLNFAKKLKSNEKILIDNVFDCKDLECIVYTSKQMIKQIIIRIDYIWWCLLQHFTQFSVGENRLKGNNN